MSESPTKYSQNPSITSEPGAVNRFKTDRKLSEKR